MSNAEFFVIILMLKSSLLASCVKQVAAIVFSEDLKKIYVTMKEGFPLEYVVRMSSFFFFSI